MIAVRTNMAPKLDFETGDFESSDALPPVTPGQRGRLLQDLLRGVSRSFYLTLHVLPSGLRQPVGLAYLLARAADTIADTRLVPPGQRQQYLLAFKAQVKGPARLEPLREIERALTDKQSVPAERELLLSLPSALSLLEATPQPDRRLVRWVVETLIQGMEFDLATFPAEDSGKVGSIADAAALDKYTYLIAGCVGEFWTRITIAQVGALRSWDQARMSRTGVSFGKALQLTNVLRDVPKDLRIGRCYLPKEEMSRLGMTAKELLEPGRAAEARPVLVDWMKRALDYYAAAEEYLVAIPKRCLRLRLAVLWPILIGLGTLARLARNQSWLDPDHPSRVSRMWVYRMLVLSWVGAYSNRLLVYWIHRLRRQVEKAL